MENLSDSEATVSDVDDQELKDTQASVKFKEQEDEDDEQEEEIVDSDIERESQFKRESPLKRHLKIEHSDDADDDNEDENNKDQEKELYCICRTSDIDRFMM